MVKYLYTTSFYHNWLLVKPDKTQAVAPKNTKIYANMFNMIELKFRKSDAHFLFEKVLSTVKKKDGRLRFYIVPHFFLPTSNRAK